MMKSRIFKIITALLSVLIIFGSFPAFALTEGSSYSYTERYLDIYYSTGRWETANGHVHDNYGQIALRNLTSTGEPLYCIQIYNGCDGSAATAKNIMYTDLWNEELTSSGRGIMILVSIYGYPNFTYSYSADEAQLATQILLWEAEIHARTNFTDGVTSFASNMNTSGRDATTLSNALKCYLKILEACQSHTTLPNFGTTSVELKGAGESNAVTLTDRNGVLSSFSVSSNNSSIRCSKNGNTLKVWSTATGNITASLRFVKEKTDINSAFALTGANQTLFYGTIADPVTANISVKLSTGNIRIVKTSEDSMVSGIQFRVSGPGYNGTVTTGSDGTITIPNLTVGTYTVTEITADKYVEPGSKTVTVVGGETATVDFSNILKKFRVTVEKQDSETVTPQGDATLEGATYGIYNNGTLIDTYTTDSRFSFTTDYYVCGDNWTLQEITPSEGYNLDDTVYEIGADPGDFTIELNTVEMTVNEDVKYASIAVIKHADDEPAQIETPEEGAEFEVYLKSSGSYESAEDSERDILVTDEYGFARSKDLPYGVYTVHQTKGLEGHDFIPDFDVFIAEDGKIYRFLLDNTMSEALIEIEKIDAETGKTIPLQGTSVKIRDLSTGEFIAQHINYPTPVDIDTFYTDTTGKFMLPEPLKYGEYELVEITAPEGYVLKSDPVPFSVDGSQETVTVTLADKPQKGIITINKSGEIFSSVSEENGAYTPVYEVKGLSDAVFQIYAAEDIITPDGTIRAEEGQLVDEITTDENGSASSVQLYLGKYRIVELTAPYTFVNSKEEYIVELTYAGQEIEVTSAMHSVSNERQKVNISLEKILEQDENFGIGMNGEILGVEFGVYAAQDITAADGTVIPANGLITSAYCDENGCLTFGCDLPIGFEWYVQEISTNEHYILSDSQYPFSTEYQGQNTEEINIEINSGAPIENDMIRGQIIGLKIDEEGFRIGGALFGLFTENETQFSEETAFMTCVSNEIGVFWFDDVPYGKYIVREIIPAPAFVLSDETYSVNISHQDQIIEIVAENTFLTGTVQVIKADKNNTETRLSGAVFEVYIDVDANQKFDPGIDLPMDKLTETETGIYRLDGLRYGGYFLHERTAPEGYYTDDGYYYFEITENQKVITVENETGTGLFVNEAIPQTPQETSSPEPQPPEEKSPKTGADTAPVLAAAAASICAVIILKHRKKEQ